VKKATRTNVIVSRRGQITLPAPLRRRLGIADGDVVVLEERRGEVVIHPSAVIEVEAYSDEDVAAWNDVDHLDARQRLRLRKKLSRSAR
jgi:AbrB family looped-hinge helix DNA binding protein